MSMYFELGDETLWNPSMGAGRLFLRQVEVYEAELELPSGIGQGQYWGDPDTLQVVPDTYAEFVHALAAWHCRTGHSVILALSEGFVATALALARRAGIEVGLPEPADPHLCGGAQREVQNPGNPRAVPTCELDARAREIDRSMAR